MLERTYLSKFNTIIKGKNFNTGLNPIAELCYGMSTTRILFYFDINNIKNLIENGTMPDRNKIKHVLRITNAGSVDFTQLHNKETSTIHDCNRQRATSFDLIFFLVPQKWDRGKGFDYSTSSFNIDFYSNKQADPNRLISTDGCNWYQARNGFKWNEEGIYSNDTLSKEYDKFGTEEGSKIIIGRQHFDIGNENISLDITSIIHKMIDNEIENNGIGIAFSPRLERIGNNTGFDMHTMEEYVGFFTDKTNTFFEPFIETTYCDYISDDRSNFVLNKDNKIYLYCSMGGTLTNLDENPQVTIKNGSEEIITVADGTKYENVKSKQYSNGVYYVEVNLPQGKFEPDTMFYDTWSNIIYKGNTFNDVELDFTTKNPKTYFNIGSSITESQNFTPALSGIKANEKIKRGDIRKVVIVAKVDFKKADASLIDGMQWRLYTKDGERELDIIPFEYVNKTNNENYVIVNTNMLIPQNYYIDIKVNYGMQSIIHHDSLHFTIVDDLNNKYL